MPRTLLIDSAQLESGDEYIDMSCSRWNERFRRNSYVRAIKKKLIILTTLHCFGRWWILLENQIHLVKVLRVVSVSMLTEGWDANTVTHVLGVRAFGTQLLCEQVVVGRFAANHMSWTMDCSTLNTPMYLAYRLICGRTSCYKTKATTWDHSSSGHAWTHHLEIKFPKVEGYRNFQTDRQPIFHKITLRLTPELVGPSIVDLQGIVGNERLTFEHTKDMRKAPSCSIGSTSSLPQISRSGRTKLHLFQEATVNLSAMDDNWNLLAIPIPLNWCTTLGYGRQ